MFRRFYTDDDESRPSSAQEELDFHRVKLMRMSFFGVSALHSARGQIGLVKTGSSLYVPSACLSSLVDLDGDRVVDVIEKMGIELTNHVIIPKYSRDHIRIRSFLSLWGIPIGFDEDICLIPIATAIRILIGSLNKVDLSNELIKKFVNRRPPRYVWDNMTLESSSRS